MIKDKWEMENVFCLSSDGAGSGAAAFPAPAHLLLPPAPATCRLHLPPASAACSCRLLRGAILILTFYRGV